MTILRHHIWAIVVYLLGVILLWLAGTLVLRHFHSGDVFGAIVALMFPVNSLAPLAVVLPLFYRRADIGRKAEWSVLAPVLMAGLVIGPMASMVIGACWDTVSRIVALPPLGLAPAFYFAVQYLIQPGFHFGISMLCVALVARYMSRPQPGCPRADHWRPIRAIVAMVIVVSLVTIIATALADALHWGTGETLEEMGQSLKLRSALIQGMSLLAIVATWIVSAQFLWRRTDELSRWSGMAAIAAWVAVFDWMRLFSVFSPWLRDYAPFSEVGSPAHVEWVVRLFLTNVFWGTAAGILAILYARLVVHRIGLKKWGYGFSAQT